MDPPEVLSIHYFFIIFRRWSSFNEVDFNRFRSQQSWRAKRLNYQPTLSFYVSPVSNFKQKKRVRMSGSNYNIHIVYRCDRKLLTVSARAVVTLPPNPQPLPPTQGEGPTSGSPIGGWQALSVMNITGSGCVGAWIDQRSSDHVTRQRSHHLAPARSPFTFSHFQSMVIIYFFYGGGVSDGEEIVVWICANVFMGVFIVVCDIRV